MKNGIMKNGIIVFIAFVLLVACSSSHDVVHNGFLQKRKYNKGYHLALKKKGNRDGSEELLSAKEEKNSLGSNKIKNFKKIKEVKEFSKDTIKEIESEEVLEVALESEESIPVYNHNNALEKALGFSKKQTELNGDKDESNSDYKTNRYVSAIGIMLLPFLFGIYFINKVKKTSKVKINESKVLNRQAKESFWFVFIGFVMLLSIVGLIILTGVYSAATPFGGLGTAFLALILIVVLAGILKKIAKSVDGLLKSIVAIKEGKSIEVDESLNREKKKKIKKRALYALLIGITSFLIGFILATVSELLSLVFLLGGLGFIIASIVLFVRLVGVNSYFAK